MPGYLCAGSTCVPSDAPATDVGQPCTSDGECDGDEQCFTEGNGWWGGYCSKFCSGGGCPDGSHCASVLEGGSSACVRDCSGGPSCRERYSCLNLDGDNRDECLPDQ